MLPFADAHGISYLGWSWNAVGSGRTCAGGPALIQSYDGTPTPFGVGFRDHLTSSARTWPRGHKVCCYARPYVAS